MDWNTYYEKFYDWASSTQISRISSLTSFGASSEVAEIAQALMDKKAASRLIRKAAADGVQFTSEEICALSDCCDKETMHILLKSAACVFTQAQLEDLWGAVDDAVLELAAKRSHVALFAEDEPVAADAEEESDFDAVAYDGPKLGFFSKLGLALGIADILNRRSRPRTGRCTGDCANCPPHYGYRYGRWYYGHGHTHGCELGGNKCSGER